MCSVYAYSIATAEELNRLSTVARFSNAGRPYSTIYVKV
jgi:hypothetical protein